MAVSARGKLHLMIRRTPDGRRAQAARSAPVAGGLLVLALATGCGSSGGGTVAGQPPSPTPSSPSDFPGPSTSPTETPSPSESVDDLRDFDDQASGITLTVPDGYVVATTPAQAAARFPDVLGGGADASTKISDAQTRLRKNTIMIAFHAPVSGISDNVGLLKVTGGAPGEPSDIQGAPFQATARASLAKAGARNIDFSETEIDKKPAEQVNYSIASPGGSNVFGEQLYVANGRDVFILTVTAGTAQRASDASTEISDSWKFD